MTDDNTYLIWSHEHSAWWGHHEQGYTHSLTKAGRYSRTDALTICARAIPGDSTRMGALPELPVLLQDVELMVASYQREFPNQSEPWQ